MSEITKIQLGKNGPAVSRLGMGYSGWRPGSDNSLLYARRAHL